MPHATQEYAHTDDGVQLNGQAPSTHTTMNDYWRYFERECEAKNFNLAIQYFIRALEMGHRKASALFDKKIASQKPAETKITSLESPEQICYRGLQAYLGLGMEQNQAEAMGWLDKAANQGYATAQYLLGNAYESGLGDLAKNENEALR